MYIKIRADIFNSAMRVAARAESTLLNVESEMPESAFGNIDFSVVTNLVPEINEMLMDYIATGGDETDPAEAFFSIDPPGIWMRLTQLVGPHSSHEGPLKHYLESNEALAVTLNKFLDSVEMTQDFAYNDQREALGKLSGDDKPIDYDQESLY